MVQKQKDTSRLSYKEKREYELIEKEIEELENEKSDLENALSSGMLGHNELVFKSNRIKEVIETIEAKTMRWLELGERI